MRVALAVAALLAFAAVPATAAVGARGIPSCYTASRIGIAASPPTREVFVLVDQTTPLDARLKAAIRDAVGPLLTPGTGFVVTSFSAFGQGRYAVPIAEGALETTVAAGKRDDLSVRALNALDRCLIKQLRFGRDLAAAAIDTAVAGQSDTLAHSDIVSSLTDFSHRVANSPAPERIVLIASDMLENSGLTSFYAHHSIRRIDPEKELKAVAKANFLADFHGARVYVLGAGLLGGGTDAYRDPASLRALEMFWDGYFHASHATLVEFGKPMLTRPVR